jgi:hypothetical protein
MRIVRTVARTIGLTALVPALAAAQAKPAPSSFVDAWYWGATGGTTMFTPVSGASRVSAPTVGGEWLITRSRIALNISIEQAFFDDVSGVFDPTVNGGVRPVDISDWRRYHASIFFFPWHSDGFRPYLGTGFAINVIQNATPQGTYTSEASLDSVFSQVNRFSSRASAVFTGGAQFGSDRVALFGQVTAMPTRSNFLITGSGYSFMLEGGLRYRISSAIEHLK